MVASRQEVATIPSRAPARTCPIIRPKNHNPVAHLPILWRHSDVVELAPLFKIKAGGGCR